MANRDSVLFKVLMGNADEELNPEFIATATRRTLTCVQELLAIAGYFGGVRATIGQSKQSWHITMRVERRLTEQLDMFERNRGWKSTAQVSAQVLQAAVVAVARFRREVGGVFAASVHEVLAQLRTADPRVIAAIARMPKGKVTFRREAGDLELNIQSESKRSLSAEVMALVGIISAVGYEEMSVIPVNRRSPRHLCLHTVRIRIPERLRATFDPVDVLSKLVKKKQRVELQIRVEKVARKPQQMTYELEAWPPTLK